MMSNQRNSGKHDHDPEQEHGHDHSHGAGVHLHGVIDPAIIATRRGIWAVKWSFVGLAATAIMQLVVVIFTGSVALLADTIHNFGDAATAVPLWAAFKLGQKKPSSRFTYGLGRVEDLAGMAVVLTILLSAVFAGYESIRRFFHPQPVTHVWIVMAASVIGFLGNEAVARFRIKVGKEIGSAALEADGKHARVDGLTSLAVFAAAIGVQLGFPLADPIIGLLITITIGGIVWGSAKTVFTRVLDGVDPQVLTEIRHAVNHTQDVCGVTQVRVRWLGHRLHAEVNIAVGPALSVERAHEIAVEVRHRLLHHLAYLSDATVHVDPVNASGEEYHHISEHEHDGLAVHSH